MLQQFGFTQYESQVYQSLVTLEEPLDATGIVKISGVPRSKVYEVLHRMVEKGLLLESTMDKKRLYTALPLDAMIDKLKTDFTNKIDRLKTEKNKPARVDDRVWTLKGDATIQALLKKLINKAEKSIFISGWADDLQVYLPLLEEKYDTGISIQIHVIGEIETHISNVSTLIPDELHNTLEQSRTLIVDEQEILFAGIENSQWQAVQTKSGPLVKFFTEFFYHDVALTEITQKYRDIVMRDDEVRNVLLKLRY